MLRRAPNFYEIHPWSASIASLKGVFCRHTGLVIDSRPSFKAHQCMRPKQCERSSLPGRKKKERKKIAK
jgi:hypothetical protein